MEGMHIWAVFSAALAAYVLGFVWYSPVLFGNLWMKAAGKKAQDKPGAAVMIGYFGFLFIAATGFAWLVGPKPELMRALHAALMVSIFFVATTVGIGHMFSGRSVKLFLVDAAYNVLQFVVFALVLGYWH